MKIIQYPLHAKQWIATETKKHYIVLHGSFARTLYTPYSGEPGRATATIDNWNNNVEKHGAPWLIDRNGDAYNTFDDKQWIYHLGIPGSRGFYDKQSIPICLANELQLIKSGSRYFAFGREHHSCEYFGKVYSRSFRGWDHFADLQEPQVDAMIELVKTVAKRHNIEPVFYGDVEKHDATVWEKATVFPHSVVHQGKVDFTFAPWVMEKIEKSGIKII